MISFDTKELKGRRRIKIDGHIYTVRRMGNIENLDYTRSVRKLKEFIDIEDKRKLTKQESNEVDVLSDRLANMTIALFDDGEDQSKSRALVSSLSDFEISELLVRAFAEDEPVKQDEQQEELPNPKS